MVALALGLLVVGVVFANYLGSRQAQRTSTALGQMTEDANLAFNLMRRYISLAGYSDVTGIDGTGLTRSYTGKSVFGCNNGFTSNVTRGIDQLSCSNSNTPKPDAISVTYQANASNSLMGGRKASPNTPEPRDALGQFLYLGSAGQPHYMAEARFMVDANGQFLVAGNGGGSDSSNQAPSLATAISAGEALFANVVDMRIWYGLSGTNSGKPDQIVNRYVEAQDIGAVTQSAWHNVTAVRVCLLLSSATEVLEGTTPYYGCDAQVAAQPALTTPADRRLYKAFTTTIYIPNRLGG